MKELDTSETNEIMEILESLENETLAVELLKEFNDKTAMLGKLLLNLDKSLEHEAWKAKCDEAKIEVEKVVQKIKESASNE